MADFSEQSWIEDANDPANGFPLSSLPYCAFNAEDGSTRLGVGLGGVALDLRGAAEAGLVGQSDPPLRDACTASQLNDLMILGPRMWSALRAQLATLFDRTASAEVRSALSGLLRPMSELRFELPVNVTDYTDFYASREHAINVGKLFRPNQPLLPNYDWVPIGYHGRASSIVISGTSVRRPHGQRSPQGASAPVFEPSKQLDYEVELAAYVATASELGEPVGINSAQQHIFGYSLLNDWSARDIQSWEYQPLGPFLGKNFATSISPWVIPSAALEPYQVSSRKRVGGEPAPLPYLTEDADARTALDISVEALLMTQRMREAGERSFLLSQANAKHLYWSFAQMIAHHTSNGCNLRAGNVFASGTISNATRGSEGCLLERGRRGADLLELPNGETRSFLEDGDEVILRGCCEGEDLPRISFGECRGIVLPAYQR